jgi:hypothetical protein
MRPGPPRAGPALMITTVFPRFLPEERSRSWKTTRRAGGGRRCGRCGPARRPQASRAAPTPPPAAPAPHPRRHNTLAASSTSQLTRERTRQDLRTRALARLIARTVGNARRPQPESNRPGSLCGRPPRRSGMRPGCAFFQECFRQESNLRLQLRRLVSYPLDHGSVRAPGWIRTTVSEEPGLRPGAIDRSATDASWGGWRDSNPAWTGVTARCFDPSASSSVRDDGLEPPAGPV